MPVLRQIAAMTRAADALSWSSPETGRFRSGSTQFAVGTMTPAVRTLYDYLRMSTDATSGWNASVRRLRVSGAPISPSPHAGTYTPHFLRDHSVSGGALW